MASRLSPPHDEQSSQDWRFHYVETKIQLKVKTTLFTLSVATGLTALLSLAACSEKNKATADSAVVTARQMLPDAPGAPVKANAVTDTTLTLGSVAEKYTLIDRIYQTDDSADFYMSVSVMVPSSQSPVTASVAGIIDTVYAALDAPRLAPAEVNTPGTLARQIDRLGEAFVEFTTPMAESSDEFAPPGYMMSVKARPVYGGTGFVTYDYATDYYVGGNTTDYNEFSVTYNPATGAVYSLDDLVVADSIPAVRSRLVGTIAADAGKTVDEYLADMTMFLGDREPLTVATFPVYNVALTPSGLVFTYPKYSIAPGCDGSPRYNLTLPDAAVSLRQSK